MSAFDSSWITMSQVSCRGERHQSSIQIRKNGLQVVGVIPHMNWLRPQTAADRDKLVAELNAIDYDANTGGMWEDS